VAGLFQQYRPKRDIGPAVGGETVRNFDQGAACLLFAPSGPDSRIVAHCGLPDIMVCGDPP
jgi:hypothetical protein